MTFAFAAVVLAAAALPREDALAHRLRELAASAGGTVAFAVTHVESGRTTSVNGATPMPLYSVFKLPLAITVMHEVEAGRLRLDEKVRITPKDVSPGSAANTRRWRKALDISIRDLLDVSIVESDNTSSDRLLGLVGGPNAVTRRMAALGFRGIVVKLSVREFAAVKGHPNTGTAEALAGLLAALQKGTALTAPQRDVLLDMMARATTGRRRLRGHLPAGTPVRDKTGSGPNATNDVGLVTLPDGLGHLAMAALVDGSKLSVERQETLIADMARAAYDVYVPSK